MLSFTAIYIHGYVYILFCYYIISACVHVVFLILLHSCTWRWILRWPKRTFFAFSNENQTLANTSSMTRTSDPRRYSPLVITHHRRGRVGPRRRCSPTAAVASVLAAGDHPPPAAVASVLAAGVHPPPRPRRSSPPVITYRCNLDCMLGCQNSY